MAADPTASFFEDLASMGHVPLLHRLSGTIRIDLDRGDDTEHWFMTIDKGDVTVNHRKSRADAVIRTTKVLFDGMAKGKVNAMAAVLREVIAIEGDMNLISALSRLFPGPPKSRITFLERQKERAG